MEGISLNGLYFLLPFILVAGLGIYQDSFAVSQITGYDYFDVTNPDGTHTWTSHEPYIFDGNNYVPFVATGNTVQTAGATVTLNADGSFTWSDKFTDRIVAKYADVTNLNSWTYPNTLNNDVPNISWDGNEFVSSKVKAGIGQLDYKYILINGKWKTQLEATNLSGLTTKAFGFDQIIDLNSDTIKFGGVTRNLDNFDGVTFDKNFLDANKAKIIDLMTGVNFDFDLGYENLYSVTVHDTGANKSQLVFDYRTTVILLPNETLIIDPTYSYTLGTEYTVRNDPAQTGTTCPTGGTWQISAADADIQNGASGSTHYCTVSAFQWDISSLPANANPTSTILRYDVTSVSSPLNCNFRAMTTKPSISTNTIWSEAISGTLFVGNDSGCTTASNDKILNLGTNANTDVKNKISGGWFAVGMSFTTQTRDATLRQVEMSDVELEITYTVGSPPNPVTVLTASSITNNALNLQWDPPTSFGTGTFQTYTINYTTPWGTPLTFLANTTNTYYNVTGLTFGTDYSFRVAARTDVAGNTTGNTILNTSTTSTSYNLPPVLLRAIPNSYTSTSQINIVWTASSMNNILGYKIERQDNGGAWSCATASCNTTNTNVYYNNTGLSTGIVYNYRISAINGSGISTPSNEKSMTTYHIPDPVTDLVATASDFTTTALSWSAPTSYAPSIIGYQVNYTTPQGTPLTIQTPDPYTTTTNAIIYGLTAGEDYSFRVSAVTFHGKNANGNIENVTTSNLFTPGQINPLISANSADFSIFYTRTDTSTTSTTLDVTYPNTYDLNCNFQYQFGGQNDTYTGLTQTIVDADDVKSTFVFNDPANDIINVRCYDTITSDEAKYVMVINQFPFLDQINNMRNGAYGSYFQFGAIDGVTLMICILAMIGFNRTNPVAGIMFLVITVGVLSWFNIITYPIIMYPALALLATWAFISTRKDD